MFKKLITVLLSATLVLSALPTVYAANSSEISSAIESGYVPDELQGNYSSLITKSEASLLAGKLAEKVLNCELAPLAYKAAGSDKEALAMEREGFTDLGVVSARTDCSESHMYSRYIHALGIIPASGNLFQPDAPLDRQTFSLVLLNTLKFIGVTPTEFQDAGLSDINEAADWARNSVNYAVNKGLMDVTADNSFRPLQLCTREEAIIAFNRALTVDVPQFLGVSFEESRESVEAKWGPPQKIIEGCYIYHNELYTEFTLLNYTEDGYLVNIYTNRMKDFDVAAFKARSIVVLEYKDPYSRVNTEPNIENMVYAISASARRTDLRTGDEGDFKAAGMGMDLKSGELFNELANAWRALYGRYPEVYNETLEVAAQRHADDMYTNDFLGHGGSDGSTPDDRANDAGFMWGVTEDAIEEGGSYTARSTLTVWMKSKSTHRGDLLGLPVETVLAGEPQIECGWAYAGNRIVVLRGNRN